MYFVLPHDSSGKEREGEGERGKTGVGDGKGGVYTRMGNAPTLNPLILSYPTSAPHPSLLILPTHFPSSYT